MDVQETKNRKVQFYNYKTVAQRETERLRCRNLDYMREISRTKTKL